MKFSIKHRLAGAILAPIALLLCAGVVASVDAYAKRNIATKALHSLELEAPLSDSIAELQKERGATSGLLSAADPALFVERLSTQRAKTDLTVVAFSQESAALTDELRGTRMLDSIDQANLRLAGLADLRQAVDNRTIAGPDALKRYTEIVSALITTTQKVEGATLTTDMNHATDALSGLILVTEASGLERATGMGILAGGSLITQAQLVKLVELQSRQAVLLNEACRQDSMACEANQADKTSPTGQRFKALQEQLMLAAQSAQVPTVPSADWFDASTARIEGMLAVEEKLVNRIHELAAEAHQSATKALILWLVLTVGCTGLTLIMGQRLAASILDPLARQTTAMTALADGQLDISITDTKRQDEFASMAVALQSFQVNERSRRESESALAAQQQAVKEREHAEFLRLETQSASNAAVNISFGKAVRRLSDCDLSQTIDEQMPEEFLALKSNFNAALGEISTAIGQVSQRARSLHATSDEIGTAANDLSRRTEQQAASLEEASAALHEATSSVANTASVADSATTTLSDVRKVAAEASHVVRDTVGAVLAIEKSANQIASIIGVIDEIAFQTNLLALNAGVEAARAGEAGRGFAVVAMEVRQLAQRSATAAKDIRQLILDSNTQVKSGVLKAEASGDALDRIVGRVDVLAEQVVEIASSAREQSQTLAQINAEIANLDQMTQHNAAMVEQTTAAALSLTREALEMSQLVGVFRLAGDGGPARVRPARPGNVLAA